MKPFPHGLKGKELYDTIKGIVPNYKPRPGASLRRRKNPKAVEEPRYFWFNDIVKILSDFLHLVASNLNRRLNVQTAINQLILIRLMKNLIEI